MTIPHHSKQVDASHHPHQKKYGEPPQLPVRQGLMALGVLLLLASAYLFYENGSLKGQLADAQDKLKEAADQNARLQTSVAALRDSSAAKDGAILNIASKLSNKEQELAAAMRLLNQTEDELEQSKATSAEEMRQLRGQFENLSGDIRAARKTLNESVQWFKANSQIPTALRDFSDSVTGRCMDGIEYNLACFPYVLEKDHEFKYLNESSDRLYSLQEIVQRDGGDCEDYALLISAMVRTVAKADPGAEIIGWVPETDGKFVVYRQGERYWYYEAKKVSLGYLDEVHPYPICYLLGNSPDGEQIGHCIVALSTEKISGIDDLGKLDGAKTFEPQSGEYMGDVGKDYRVCRSGEECTGGADIITVMVEDDLYQFSDEEWTSFKSQDARAAQVLVDATAVMNEAG